MNDQHAMVLRAADGGEMIHAVEYATLRARDRLASLAAGDTARIRATRVGLRADVWRVERTYPGTETGTGTGTGTAAAPDDADGEPLVSSPDAV